MSHFAGRSTWILTIFLTTFAQLGGCGRTNHDDRSESMAGASAAGASAAGASAAGSDVGGSAGTAAQPPLTLGGLPNEPEPPEPTASPGTCHEADRPGEPCDRESCWGTRCGEDFALACVNGRWVLNRDTEAFELICVPGNEFVANISDIDSGMCCGEQLPRNDLVEPQSCGLCPATEPFNGAPCSLPEACAPQLIDCFYRCCCYGTLTWAQCDGERWHVATECSDP